MVIGTMELEEVGRVDAGPSGPVALAEVVDEVRRDSREDPQAFLDETIVPHGGE